MTLKLTYPETMTKAAIYALTQDPTIEKFSDHIGEEIKVHRIIIREEDEKIITSVSDDSGHVYATNSPTVAKSLLNAFGIGVVRKFIINKGVSKSGRDYIDVRVLEFDEEE